MQFHADQCYYENPAKGAVLYGLEIPSKGGNTLFASTYAAYDRLAAALRERAERIQVLFLYDYQKNANRKAPTDWSDAPLYPSCGHRASRNRTPVPIGKSVDGRQHRRHAADAERSNDRGALSRD